MKFTLISQTNFSKQYILSIFYIKRPIKRCATRINAETVEAFFSVVWYQLNVSHPLRSTLFTTLELPNLVFFLHFVSYLFVLYLFYSILLYLHSLITTFPLVLAWLCLPDCIHTTHLVTNGPKAKAKMQRFKHIETHLLQLLLFFEYIKYLQQSIR